MMRRLIKIGELSFLNVLEETATGWNGRSEIFRNGLADIRQTVARA
jgi:hypothetical protein